MVSNKNVSFVIFLYRRENAILVELDRKWLFKVGKNMENLMRFASIFLITDIIYQRHRRNRIIGTYRVAGSKTKEYYFHFILQGTI